MRSLNRDNRSFDFIRYFTKPELLFARYLRYTAHMNLERDQVYGDDQAISVSLIDIWVPPVWVWKAF
jgi:hypothetical protein